jgi:hypothetical protein
VRSHQETWSQTLWVTLVFECSLGWSTGDCLGRKTKASVVAPGLADVVDTDCYGISASA